MKTHYALLCPVPRRSLGRALLEPIVVLGWAAIIMMAVWAAQQPSTSALATGQLVVSTP